MSPDNQDQLVVDEVRRHYKDSDSPYYLSGLGQFFRAQDIEIPTGVRFKDFLKSRFQDRLSVVQDPDVPAKIAIAPLENVEDVQQQLKPQVPVVGTSSQVDVNRIPFALITAFCIRPGIGERVYFRTARPYRYVVGQAAPDETYLEIDEEDRPSRLAGSSIHGLSAADKQEIYERIEEWARANNLDLRDFYYGNGRAQIKGALSTGAPATSALRRLVEAQTSEMKKQILIPGDVAIMLSELA